MINGRMITMTTTDTMDTKKKSKKRIFYPNRFYLVDKDNYVLHQAVRPESFKGLDYEDTDTILIAVHPSKFIEKTKVVKKIVLDFEKNLLTIEGDTCTLNKVEYEGDSTYELDAEELKGWSDLLKDCKKVAKEFEMIGTPPIEGEIINVE